ncbi:hypothetical protein PPERSA_08430 [Pseudocohnilembus persalinus]|uniref:Uncharacterized protein n=1 Tax=Pseudocohnilembus persalinus TaxID=266149 RepID=A0A0V0R6D1_PSEPJ|nr:hypothetical protein PPERSA_08430 [Pseudocohnilembus persalinus]|eukprot:KRX10027.1 hypothetical protein PPERSA_08430 [Pseudocohnilembus persalinus]
MLIQNSDKLGEIQTDQILNKYTKEIFITVQEIISNFQNNELTLNSIKVEMSVRKDLISKNINECLEKDEEFDFTNQLNEIEKFYHKKIEQLINQNKKLEQQMDEQEKKLNESLQKEKSLQLQLNDYQNKTLDFFYKHTQEQPQVICELIKQAGKQNEYLELLNPQQKNGQQTNKNGYQTNRNGQFQEQIQNSNHQNGLQINYNGNQLEESKSNYQQHNQNGGYNDIVKNPEKKLISEEFHIISEDVNYFLEQFKPENEIQNELLQKCTGKIVKYSVAGTCLGISLSLSLRRYMPQTFGQMSALRVGLETVLVLGGYTQFSKFATYQVYTDLNPLRKGATLNNNQDYLRHLIWQYYNHPSQYQQPSDTFRNILTEEELNDWVRKYKIDLDILFQTYYPYKQEKK